MDPTSKNVFRPHALSDEARWFAYADERHAGPFSTVEVQAKLIDESLRPGDYVWTTGMADWHPISELELFYPDAPVPHETPAATPDATETYATERSAAKPVEIYVDRPTETAVLPPPNRRLAYLAAASIGFILLAATLLSRGGNSLPKIGDISVEDGIRLQDAASVPYHSGALTAAPAIAIGDLAHPVFYVATNSPDGGVVRLYLEGISGTVLAHTKQKFAQALTIEKHLGRSLPFAHSENRPLSRGNYRLTITDSAGARIGERTFFLGGLADENYRLTLAAKNANLPKQLRGELTELRQLAAAIEDQLQQTMNHSPLGGQWPEFSRRWTQFQGQLADELRPTPTDEEDVAYLDLFARARTTLAQIGKIHSTQSTVRMARKNRDALEIEIAEAGTVAQSGLLALKSEIALAEKKLSAAPRK